MLSTFFQVARPEPGALAETGEDLVAELSPAQVAALQQFLAVIRQTGQCTIVTGLDAMLSAFSGADLGEDTIQVLADYLAAGGVLVFASDMEFDWFYAQLLRPLIVKLGPRSPLLGRALPILSGGREMFAFEDGGYRLISTAAHRDKAGGFDVLVGFVNEEGLQGIPAFETGSTAYIDDSIAHGRIDRAIASRVGVVIDVGQAIPTVAGTPIRSLQRSYQRTLDVLMAATAAMHESSRVELPPTQPEVGDTLLWTFARPQFPTDNRLRVRVTGSGFVHAGVAGPDGAWAPVYNVPLMPMPEGDYEAVLPSGVNAFTFFWTEGPWTPGRPGHWERGPNGVQVFRARE